MTRKEKTSPIAYVGAHCWLSVNLDKIEELMEQLPFMLEQYKRKVEEESEKARNELNKLPESEYLKNCTRCTRRPNKL
jgi:ribosome assembly protein YihI (activator of Der GTPase)